MGRFISKKFYLRKRDLIKKKDARIKLLYARKYLHEKDIEYDNYAILDNEFIKVRSLQKRHNWIKMWLFLKPTLNNLYAYIYEIHYKFPAKKLFNKYSVKKQTLKYRVISVGVVGYKGPTKTSNIAAEELGLAFAKKVRLILKVYRVNLVLYTRSTRRIKEFLKGFSKFGKVRIRHIFFMPKFAHNGCRLKKKSGVNNIYILT